MHEKVCHQATKMVSKALKTISAGRGMLPDPPSCCVLSYAACNPTTSNLMPMAELVSRPISKIQPAFQTCSTFVEYCIWKWYCLPCCYQCRIFCSYHGESLGTRLIQKYSNESTLFALLPLHGFSCLIFTRQGGIGRQ